MTLRLGLGVGIALGSWLSPLPLTILSETDTTAIVSGRLISETETTATFNVAAVSIVDETSTAIIVEVL